MKWDWNSVPALRNFLNCPRSSSPLLSAPPPSSLFIICRKTKGLFPEWGTSFRKGLGPTQNPLDLAPAESSLPLYFSLPLHSENNISQAEKRAKWRGEASAEDIDRQQSKEQDQNVISMLVQGKLGDALSSEIPVRRKSLAHSSHQRMDFSPPKQRK